MDMYAQKILDHYKNPHNCGCIDDADISHSEDNPLCGDTLSVDLKIDGEILVDLKFSGNGCAISQAAISMLSEKIIGSPLSEIEMMNKHTILNMLGVPIGERRMKCALLCLLVIKNALSLIKKDDMLKWRDIL